jgi:TP901-1 family phage major tail protein
MAVTAGKIRSNSIGVYISTSQGASTIDDTATDDTYELIACSTSGSFTGSMEVIDATTKDNDGQREILTGGLTWSMSAEGMVQYDLASTVNSNINLFDLWANKTKIRLAWSTGSVDDYMYYGNAYITSYEESAGLNEVASYSVTFEGDGAITKAVVVTGNTWHNNND